MVCTGAKAGPTVPEPGTEEALLDAKGEVPLPFTLPPEEADGEAGATEVRESSTDTAGDGGPTRSEVAREAVGMIDGCGGTDEDALAVALLADVEAEAPSREVVSDRPPRSDPGTTGTEGASGSVSASDVSGRKSTPCGLRAGSGMSPTRWTAGKTAAAADSEGEDVAGSTTVSVKVSVWVIETRSVRVSVRTRLTICCRLFGGRASAEPAAMASRTQGLNGKSMIDCSRPAGGRWKQRRSERER